MPMPAGLLNYTGWRKLTSEYPDRAVAKSNVGICPYGPRIGYEGARGLIQIHLNLASAEEVPEIVTTEIEEELRMNRLKCYPSYTALSYNFTATPWGLVDKSNGSKGRIHHLFLPADDSSSINGGIPEAYRTIAYSTVEDTIAAVQRFGNCCQLKKWDFASRFRHIPGSPFDTPLLAFGWQGKYYSEQFLLFGLRIAPILFNLFAETFHWILANKFTKHKLPVSIVHYLDDFLLIIPTESKLQAYSKRFSLLCEEVGLVIKETKNEKGWIASFGGVEIDMEKMVIRLP